MESRLELSSSSSSISSPSNNKTLSNSIAVFSSIENRNDIVSERNAKPDMNAKANMRSTAETTKRYAISSGIKDNFYAIRHIPRSSPINENEPLQTIMDIKSENMEPVKPKSKKSSSFATSNRGRKRISPELVSSLPTVADHPPLNTQLDTAVPKRKKSRHGSSKTRNNSKDQPTPSLNRTCSQLWPDPSNISMGDLSYENIKSLKNLLKVRLSQAKFRMMAKLDQDNEVFTFLSEEYIPPKPRKPIAITGKQSKSTMAVVGNNKNLFARNNKLPKRYSVTYHDATSLEAPSTPMDAIISPQQANQKTPNNRKKKSSKTITPKTKRITTPKRRSAAADVIPVTLSDGSCVYVCEPCNKKYKNRNGLAYHMERCKHTKKPPQDDHHTSKETSQSQESTINCICSRRNDETLAMVQCDTCRTWLHSECVGLTEETLEDSYCCAKCKSDQSESNRVGKDLLQCLLEAQASDRLEQQQKQASQSTSSPNSQFQELFGHSTPQNEDTQLSQLQEFLSQTPIRENNNSEEDDERSSMPQSGGFLDEDLLSDSQLHIWDDFNTASFDKEQQQQQQWSLLDDEEPFSNYDTDSWTLNDINLFSQPPSLLFSDTTVNSGTLEDDSMPVISTPAPISESTPLGELTPKRRCDTPMGISSSAGNTPVQTADGLWFQFANFDDDYQCETEDT